MNFSDRIHDLFDYTEQEFRDGDRLLIGGLVWRNPSNRLAPIVDLHGVALAGTWGLRGKSFYGRVKVDGGMYYLHRLVWIYHNGDIPDDLEIDHRDTNTFDSRIGNLREASPDNNRRNRNGVEGSSSSFVGVSKGRRGKWRARVMLDRKEHSFGEYSTEEAAAIARDRGAVALFGDFAHLNFPENRRLYEIAGLA